MIVGCETVTVPTAAASGRKPETIERMEATPALCARKAFPPAATAVGELLIPSAMVTVIESATPDGVTSLPIPGLSLTMVAVIGPPPRRTSSALEIEVPVGVAGVPIET